MGLSRRRNEAGFENFRRILEKYGMTATAVPVRGVLHLKTGVDYLSDNRLLAAGEFIGQPVFSQFEETPIAPEEAYADLRRLRPIGDEEMPQFSRNVDKWLTDNPDGTVTFRRETRTMVLWWQAKPESELNIF